MCLGFSPTLILSLVLNCFRNQSYSHTPLTEFIFCSLRWSIWMKVLVYCDFSIGISCGGPHGPNHIFSILAAIVLLLLLAVAAVVYSRCHLNIKLWYKNSYGDYELSGKWHNVAITMWDCENIKYQHHWFVFLCLFRWQIIWCLHLLCEQWPRQEVCQLHS